MRIPNIWKFDLGRQQRSGICDNLVRSDDIWFGHLFG